jgi:RNA polymerase primary sigma factor
MKTTTSNTKSSQNSNTTLSMKCYFKEINHFPLLSREEEIELGTRIQKNRDPEALEKMINSNLKLVVKIANDYSKFGLDVEDLVSEGNIGLMKAAEKFDPKFGVKFSTYASWWIKQMVKRALGNQSRTIRLPLHVLQKLRDLDQAERELGDELGRDPLETEISERVGLAPK